MTQDWWTDLRSGAFVITWLVVAFVCVPLLVDVFVILLKGVRRALVALVSGRQRSVAARQGGAPLREVARRAHQRRGERLVGDPPRREGSPLLQIVRQAGGRTH